GTLDRVSNDPHFDQILRFLDERLTDSAATLTLYERVFRGAKEKDQAASLIHAELKLSGLVKRDQDGNLITRNQIYRRLFDASWLETTKPKRELKRSRRFAGAATTLLVLGLLGGGIYYQQRVAPQQTVTAARDNLVRLGLTLSEEPGRGLVITFPKNATDANLREVLPELSVLIEHSQSGLVLVLNDTSVTDLALLEKLTNLHLLSLHGTHVSKIAPIEKLTNLQWLSLSGTQVSNIAPIEKLTNLQWLSLSGTQVSNIAPIEKLTNLQWLSLSGTQ